MPSYKLFYFDGRGRAELCRILFQLAGQEFEDVRFFKEDWPKVKPTTPFGQVPYLEIDGKPYAQGVALATYLAAQFGYYGETNLDKLRIDQVVGLVADLLAEIVRYFFENDEAKKAELMKNFSGVVTPKFFGFFEGLLKKNGTGFFVGKSLTLADLTVYDIVYGIKVKQPRGLLDNFPLVAALYDRVENLDRLKTYLANRKVTEF